MRFLTRATIFGFRIAPVLLLVYWICIFTGTHLPGSAVKSMDISDKVMHFGAFAGLAFLLAWTLPHRVGGRLPGTVVAAGLSILYAVVDEWTQGFVANRTPSVDDLVADAAGMTVGLITYLILRALLYGYLESSSPDAAEPVAPPS